MMNYCYLPRWGGREGAAGVDVDSGRPSDWTLQRVTKSFAFEVLS